MSITSANQETQAAAHEAAKAAALEMTVEIWSLYGVALLATMLRTYARIRAVGIKNLRSDDYFVWVGTLFYTAQSALGYSVGNLAHGLANNGMSDVQRAALSPDDPEYKLRVTGSKIQIAGWTVYSALIWSLKLSMLAFYVRLTIRSGHRITVENHEPNDTTLDQQEGLGRGYRIHIYIGFALVIATFIATISTIIGACRPFHLYWQINPNPGNQCQAAVSKPIVWVSFAANVSTDIYLILIPLPMLWNSRLQTLKKLLSSIVLCAGIFVLVCATLKTVFVLVDPVKGAQLAGSWGIREAFTAEITTNLPMLFPLIKSLVYPLFGISRGSSQKPYQSPSGFRTIGGGGGSHSQNRRRLHDDMADNLTITESEERIVGADMRMRTFSAAPASTRTSSTGIVVSSQVQVTREESGSPIGDSPAARRSFQL